jgi:hypothetical protein
LLLPLVANRYGMPKQHHRLLVYIEAAVMIF